MPDVPSKILEKSFLVSIDEAIHFMGPEVTPALSTPSMIRWMELTSRECISGLLKPGEDTVGISLSIKHLAPTPVDMRVKVTATLENIDGRVYSFRVEAFDEIEKIGEGTHQRARVAIAKFGSRIASKKAQGAG